MTLRDQLARFHAAITGLAPLASARDLVEAGTVGAGERVDELERLHVYEHAYTARIADVLVHDYPKLARLVGDDILRSWTASYLRAHPPRNFSLREVGCDFADWLATGASRHQADLADLARLERARSEVFDGPDAAPLAREDLATVDPVEFPSLRLRLVPSSRVLALATNADDVWDALENDQTTAPPSPSSPRTVLVWRRELAVIHRTLEPDEARLIPSMIAGTTFGAACELLDETSAAERAIELLVRWLDAQILSRA